MKIVNKLTAVALISVLSINTAWSKQKKNLDDVSSEIMEEIVNIAGSAPSKHNTASKASPEGKGLKNSWKNAQMKGLNFSGRIGTTTMIPSMFSDSYTDLLYGYPADLEGNRELLNNTSNSLLLDFGIDLYYGKSSMIYSAFRIGFDIFMNQTKDEVGGSDGTAFNFTFSRRFGVSLGKEYTSNIYAIVAFSLYSDETYIDMVTGSTVFSGVEPGIGYLFMPKRTPIGFFVDFTVPIWFSSAIGINPDSVLNDTNDPLLLGSTFMPFKIATGIQLGF